VSGVDGANWSAARPVSRDERWVEREIDGETVLLPVRGGATDLQFLFVLNVTASWIWRQLDGVRDAAALAAALAAEFDVEPQQAAADVNELLQSFSAAGLIAPARPVAAEARVSV
jgi:hypothetical protein